mmetsp:Transcript_23488/g.51965  ORF Transcript_23488/g.51965 Transcript_23488/m.51965 type:complete len:366 (-) Transcript_23488:94-1191(-)
MEPPVPQADAAPLDVEAMIRSLLLDPSRASLELPRTMTPEERKQARRLADSHPELKCESFGFGAERQLHLFKKPVATGQDQSSSSAPNEARVRVKNTFIDDWEGASGGEAHLNFRSMPVALLERTLQRCLLGAKEESLEAVAPESTQGEASPRSCVPDLPALPEGLQVRNTFIHIESMPVVERIVQSMPDGMFRQCLQAELSAQRPAVADSSAPEASVASVASVCAAGTAGAAAGAEEVLIQGLVKLPDFNGLHGVVQALDADSGRYDVLLSSPAGSCGWRWVKVKAENLRPTLPPPPRNAPTLSMDITDASEEGAGPPEGTALATTPSAPASVPQTPTWDDQDVGEPQVDPKTSATPLRLNALV